MKGLKVVHSGGPCGVTRVEFPYSGGTCFAQLYGNQEMHIGLFDTKQNWDMGHEPAILSQSDVRKLLPLLQHFAETGELPKPDDLQQ